MAFAFQSQYEPEVVAQVRAFYATLSEKDRRRYVASEARRLGHGGIEYMAKVFGCSQRTIERGLADLDKLPFRDGCGVLVPVEKKDSVRAGTRTESEIDSGGSHCWGSRQRRCAVDGPLAAADCGRGDGHGNTHQSTGRTRLDESTKAGATQDRESSGRRTQPDRDAQFLRIAELKAKYFAAGDPVFSFDTKAKEHLGQLFREGRVWTQQAFRAFDHDFPSWATGAIIPHGIYDLVRNCGHINIGLNHDTSQFACDSLRWYWNRIGQRCYPHAQSILLLCDCGGSNSAAQYLFKNDLQHLVNDLGIEIRVAHYPSYCSKFNPIERRFFPHVGRACQGMLFDTLDTVVRLMRKASTTTGLRTTVNVIRRAYEIGRKVANGFKTTMTILFDNLLPKWNYVAKPQ